MEKPIPKNIDSVSCRVCNGQCYSILSIGDQSLANYFVEIPQDLPKYPLELAYCKECSHTQLIHTIPPSDNFSTYQYCSGTSTTMREYFNWFADMVISDTGVIKGVILELASNDGSQLDAFASRGWVTYGVDPAQNITKIAIDKGHNVTVDFWGEPHVTAVYKSIKLDVIVAQNVLAHVPEPVKFLKACADVMCQSTKLYIQTSQCDMYANGEFDTIYHEHLSFFTAKSMCHAAELAGLKVIDLQKTKVHGGSYLATMILNGESKVAENVSLIIASENDLGIYDGSYYPKYRSLVYSIHTWIQNTIIQMSSEGYSIIGFGAAAKGITAIQFFEISQYFDYIVDESPLKIGKYTPSTNILVTDIKRLQNDTRKVAIVILAWNFAEEILQKITKIRSPGTNTSVIMYFPKQYVQTI